MGLHARTVLPDAALAGATVHGGRLAGAMAAYPDALRPWIDLSTGINPDAWSGPRATLEALSRLPDPAEVAQLEAIAARAFGVADPARVVATAGAEAALRWLPQLMATDDIEIVSPTYGGHEQAWRLAGAAPRRIGADDLPASDVAAVLVVNPNNPDGRVFSRAALSGVAEGRARRGRWTIVDESFVEVQPQISLADLELDRLIVLRSFGKFYGLAGLRLGFMIGPPDVARRLRGLQGDWPISAEAVVMGAKAYGDEAWRTQARARIAQRAADLDAALAAAGLSVVGGTGLFRLVSTPDAAATFAKLCRAGILTRPFADRPDGLRFGLPRQADLGRLSIALGESPR